MIGTVTGVVVMVMVMVRSSFAPMRSPVTGRRHIRHRHRDFGFGGAVVRGIDQQSRVKYLPPFLRRARTISHVEF